jgi:hypothetical protein
LRPARIARLERCHLTRKLIDTLRVSLVQKPIRFSDDRCEDKKTNHNSNSGNQDKTANYYPPARKTINDKRYQPGVEKPKREERPVRLSWFHFYTHFEGKKVAMQIDY